MAPSLVEKMGSNDLDCAVDANAMAVKAQKFTIKDYGVDIALDGKESYFEVIETLQTKGYGVNGKIGLIYKPVEYVRLGLAFHSPTFYELTDNHNCV